MLKSEQDVSDFSGSSLKMHDKCTRPGSSNLAKTAKTAKSGRANSRHRAQVRNHPELHALSLPRGLGNHDIFSAETSESNDMIDDVVHGPQNLENLDYLNNTAKLHSVLLNSYLKQGLSVRDLSKQEKLKNAFNINQCLEKKLIPLEAIDPAPAWKKSVFTPFKQERDHLGRLLDSVSKVVI